MEVKLVLDEEEETLVKYYAETLGVSVEEAFMGAIMYSIRRMYETQEKEQAAEEREFESIVDDMALGHDS